MGTDGLARYAEIAAAMIGLGDPDAIYAVAAAHGLDRTAWDALNAHWTARFSSPREGDRLQRELLPLLRNALVTLCGGLPHLDLADYAQINAAIRAGKPVDNVLTSHGLDMRRYSAASYEWMVRFAREPLLAARFGLLVNQGIARRKHEAARADGVLTGPGNLVRARRCHRCNALKVMRPRTAYVYCDYCAAVFDYDVRVVLDDQAALDPVHVEQQLVAATRKKKRAAIERGDRAALAELVRWETEVGAEVSPGEFSPRIRDPGYRRRLIEDVIVPWSLAVAFAPEHRAALHAYEELLDHTRRDPRIERVLALHAFARRSWELDVAMLEREGILARHPDEYDRDLFLYLNASVFVRPWLAVLSDADQERLLIAAGVRCDYVAAPVVRFDPCGCGMCGAQHHAPADATRTLCESCGHILELAARSFPCAGCGARVSLPVGASEAKCGYCEVRWVL